jgi:small subunit ribosomal protein S21
VKEKKFQKKVKKEDMIVWGSPLSVKVVDGNIDLAIKFWKKKLKDSGKIEELKERRYYTKPSEKRRKELQQTRRFVKFKNS